MVSLTDTDVARYEGPEITAFRRWLDSHHVRDITDEAGTLVVEHYRTQWQKRRQENKGKKKWWWF